MILSGDFYERGAVSVFDENPILGITTVEYVTDDSRRRLVCCSWHAGDGIPRKRSLSSIIWTYPLFFAHRKGAIGGPRLDQERKSLRGS